MHHFYPNFFVGGRRELHIGRPYAAGRRAMMLAQAQAMVRAGYRVVIADLNGGVHLTESPMTNAKVRPVERPGSRICDEYLGLVP